MFEDAPDGLERFQSLSPADLDEHTKLVVRDVRSGKLGLVEKVRGGDAIFTVPKADGVTDREVWNGMRVLGASSRPPKPPGLANPEAFARNALRPGERLLLSRRDCKCLFDQLRTSEDLTSFFGRPAVEVSELRRAGLSLEEISECVGAPVTCDTRLCPVSKVCPLGFSWSSLVAQSSLLQVMWRSGIDSKSLVSLGRPLPCSARCLAGLATDDFVHPASAGKLAARRATRRFESVCGRGNRILNDAKSLTAVHSGTVIGLRFDEGQYVSLDPDKLATFVQAILYL